MKKLVIAASIMAALGTLSAAQAASTGTITFNGLLTANTCDVSVDGKGPDATVILPTVGTNVLDVAGKTTGRTGFNMALTDCEGSLKTASTFFQAGASVDPVTGRLKNMTGTAKNVDLQLRDGSSSSQAVINAGNSSQVLNTTYVDISSGSAVLPYMVEYYAKGATEAGTVVSSVVYNLQYK
ncbi:type 1 fimbrial protein [Klebsiella huaxiensis]|uniref:fimbrial protein n=1 Tax=Klebsiella huaxiensis TaxID=2153354 RepID=UPI002F34542A